MSTYAVDTEDCTCAKCVSDCHRTPGWPMPDEARKLIDAGYADRLMLDWWCDYPEDVYLLCPAAQGCAGDRAPTGPEGPMGMFSGWTKGRCVLLTDDRCEVHDVAKPCECRVTDHAVDGATISAVREHEIVVAWRGAQELVAEWCEIVGCPSP